MDLPNKVDFLHTTIQFKLQDSFMSSEVCDEQGSYHPKENIILLDSSIIDKKNADSAALVWHELSHVIYYYYGLEKMLQEESVVNAMSNGFVEILKRNKQFKKWMDICLSKN